MSDQEISSDHETTTYYRNIEHHHHHQHVFTIPTLELEEEGVKEESDTIKQHKRMRSAQLHNHNERLRRQRLKEKMKTLQELIPNCRKRDKSSTFDDAIKYIKTLQHQVQVSLSLSQRSNMSFCHKVEEPQVLSAGAGYSTFNMMPQPEPVQQGMQFPPFLQTGPPSIGVKHAIGMGMSTMLPSLGIPNPWFMPSSDASGLSAPGGISAATSLEMQGPISEQSTTRRELTATTRVLPTKIVHSKDVVDYGYGSTGEWFFFYPFQLI